MNPSKIGLRALLVGGLIVSQFAVGVAQTQPRNERHIRAAFFGLHSLAPGRTARINIVNAVLGVPPEPDRPGETNPPGPDRRRRVTLMFDVYAQTADGSVRTLRFLRRVSRNLTLAPGEAVSFDFTAQAADGSVLVAATAFVSRAGSPPEPDQPVAVISTLEILQGARTLFTLPGLLRGFDPQTEPAV